MDFCLFFKNLFVNYIEVGACDVPVAENTEVSVKKFVSL